jgi:hypothetical protein
MVRLWVRLMIVGLMLWAAAGRPALAQQDNDAEADADFNPKVQAVQEKVAQFVPQVNNDQVDQWVFGRFGGAAGARTKLDSALTLKIDELERLCGLSETQKKKLLLAGKGDIKRYFDKVEELKRKAAVGQNGMNQNIWQDLQPLQAELNTGLFGEESLYTKMVRRTLNDDQIAHFESQLRERKQARYQSTVEWFVMHVDRALGLSDLQRQQFVSVLVTETPPPSLFGRADYTYLMLQSAKLPEAKIKPIFDTAQWRLLSRQFNQARMMEQWLRQTQVIAGGGDQGGRGAVVERRVLIRAAPLMPAAKAVVQQPAEKKEQE